MRPRNTYSGGPPLLKVASPLRFHYVFCVFTSTLTPRSNAMSNAMTELEAAQAELLHAQAIAVLTETLSRDTLPSGVAEALTKRILALLNAT